MVVNVNILRLFLSYQFQTLGNHETDHGIAGLLPFLERIETPIVSCNIEASEEPELDLLFTKSTILKRSGKQIGVVGVTTTLASNWGKARVLPEIEPVRQEVAKLHDQGINIIIVLSHAGLSVDQEIAKEGGPIDIIVGGHSHSFLFSGSPTPGPDKPVGDYPIIVKQENGHEVLIVQASAYTKYLGNITLFFNDDGVVESYEGAPIFLSHDIPQDEEILEKLKPWQLEISQFQNKLIGKIKFDLDGYCYSKECSMGNLVTDSMAYAVRNF